MCSGFLELSRSGEAPFNPLVAASTILMTRSFSSLTQPPRQPVCSPFVVYSRQPSSIDPRKDSGSHSATTLRQIPEASLLNPVLLPLSDSIGLTRADFGMQLRNPHVFPVNSSPVEPPAAHRRGRGSLHRYAFTPPREVDAQHSNITMMCDSSNDTFTQRNCSALTTMM